MEQGERRIDLIELYQIVEALDADPKEEIDRMVDLISSKPPPKGKGRTRRLRSRDVLRLDPDQQVLWPVPKISLKPRAEPDRHSQFPLEVVVAVILV